jgi:hypothetical protein
VKLTTSPAQGSRRRGDRRRGHSRTNLACCFSDVKRLSCTGAGTQDPGGTLHVWIWTIWSGDLPQGDADGTRLRREAWLSRSGPAGESWSRWPVTGNGRLEITMVGQALEGVGGGSLMTERSEMLAQPANFRL